MLIDSCLGKEAVVLHLIECYTVIRKVKMRSEPRQEPDPK